VRGKLDCFAALAMTGLVITSPSPDKSAPSAPEQRFGLYHVDFDTKRRTPKLSASFYRETIARNAVV
jgi:beta-glucosidase/6-phospho-beta-glucosidase/beta-galactosidase